ncbi:MAG: RNA-binding S4 domain-containing protein [Peptoniphilaceae bacterium]|uniref:RNA-binding S4 domain-containing protein n=1 Tax=Parvimonas sp. TaxID=1944660 RepID=UPI0025CF6116|nr:RNA-binding S4 domain-containing protein [Parvimonas sp.]MCI5997712.1 RNA-binding S4 domain-containing protein [Parvimonas sp.]MDD7765567.1 RNA-binding S4 domain-containing protein [Peptoniphilaceae bacterium]MDY3051108.1 RNA-binding S4 domain-containing protein [Parvimonas sp.]
MRIDKFLKNSRIIKRRTVAKEACEKERVFRDGKAMKPSDEVKVGDIIEIQFGNSNVKIRVLDITDSQKKEDSLKMYENI